MDGIGVTQDFDLVRTVIRVHVVHLSFQEGQGLPLHKKQTREGIPGSSVIIKCGCTVSAAMSL